MWEKMWSNMGNKLKVLAQIICIIGMIISLIQAIGIWSINTADISVHIGNANVYQGQSSTFWTGLWALLLGCVLSWVGSFVLYGFGIIVGFAENGGNISPKGILTSDGGITSAFWSTWTCPECKTENPKSKVQCQKCGAIRKDSQ